MRSARNLAIGPRKWMAICTVQCRGALAYPEGGASALARSGWTNKAILNDSPFGVLAWVYRRRRGGAGRRTFFGRRPTSPQVRAGLLPDARGRVADHLRFRLHQSVCAGMPYRLSMPRTFERARRKRRPVRNRYSAATAASACCTASCAVPGQRIHLGLATCRLLATVETSGPLCAPFSYQRHPLRPTAHSPRSSVAKTRAPPRLPLVHRTPSPPPQASPGRQHPGPVGQVTSPRTAPAPSTRSLPACVLRAYVLSGTPDTSPFHFPTTLLARVPPCACVCLLVRMVCARLRACVHAYRRVGPAGGRPASGFKEGTGCDGSKRGHSASASASSPKALVLPWAISPAGGCGLRVGGELGGHGAKARGARACGWFAASWLPMGAFGKCV